MSKSNLYDRPKTSGPFSLPPSYISNYEQPSLVKTPTPSQAPNNNNNNNNIPQSSESKVPTHVPPPPSTPPHGTSPPSSTPPPPNYPPPGYGGGVYQTGAPKPQFMMVPQPVPYPVYPQSYVPYGQAPQFMPMTQQPGIVNNPVIFQGPFPQQQQQSSGYMPVSPPVVHKKVVEYSILQPVAAPIVQTQNMTNNNTTYTQLKVESGNSPTFYRPVTFHESGNSSNAIRPITFFDSNNNINVQRPIMFYDSNDKIPDAAKVIGNEAGKIFLGHSKFY